MFLFTLVNPQRKTCNSCWNDGFQVSSSSEGDEELIQGEINHEGDATDSENEAENSAASDEEQDVSYTQYNFYSLLKP